MRLNPLMMYTPFLNAKVKKVHIRIKNNHVQINLQLFSSWKPSIRQNIPPSFSMKAAPNGTYMTRGSANSVPLVFLC